MKKLEKVYKKSKAIKDEYKTANQLENDFFKQVEYNNNLLPILKKKLDNIKKKIDKIKNNTSIQNANKIYELNKEKHISMSKIRDIESNRIMNNYKYKKEQGIENAKDLFNPNNIKQIEGYNEFCEECSNIVIHDIKTSRLICTICGYTKFYLDQDIVQWSDEVRVTTPFKYSRINNFKVHLQRLQGVEAKNVPDDVINNVLIEIKNSRINVNNLDHSKIKKILKQLDHNKYYNNIPIILYRIAGKKPPMLSREFCEELERMFLKVEKQFENHKNKFKSNRTHFFSYNFVFNKLLRLIEKKYPNDSNIPKLIPLFPLLKSRTKLVEQDYVFKFICDDLGWEYMRSV
jgi:ribosomal protein S27AE